MQSAAPPLSRREIRVCASHVPHVCALPRTGDSDLKEVEADGGRAKGVAAAAQEGGVTALVDRSRQWMTRDCDVLRLGCVKELGCSCPGAVTVNEIDVSPCMGGGLGVRPRSNLLDQLLGAHTAMTLKLAF